jgi:hypothetical protein
MYIKKLPHMSVVFELRRDRPSGFAATVPVEPQCISQGPTCRLSKELSQRLVEMETRAFMRLEKSS